MQRPNKGSQEGGHTLPCTAQDFLSFHQLWLENNENPELLIPCRTSKHKACCRTKLLQTPPEHTLSVSLYVLNIPPPNHPITPTGLQRTHPTHHKTAALQHSSMGAQIEQCCLAPHLLLNHLLHHWNRSWAVSLVLAMLKPEMQRTASAASSNRTASPHTEGIQSQRAGNYLPAGFNTAPTSLALH